MISGQLEKKEYFVSTPFGSKVTTNRGNVTIRLIFYPSFEFKIEVENVPNISLFFTKSRTLPFPTLNIYLQINLQIIISRWSRNLI